MAKQSIMLIIFLLILGLGLLALMYPIIQKADQL
jgi:hypothetical protein